ncbi:AAA family ATPase [Desulfoferrobacter suflitae]|uniref:AAA family ATPase n=1 Tax=Desulfoferrobacter suflitae TaxID=2865782 RepID=UPI0021646D0F|nr:AAA family ATPase [Desulfoferrobacter suflitae]MCK8600090.1 AAA family ATPase [Desulfoferrobacter suflitae]
MLQDYLRAGYPAILLLTQEPHRAEGVLPCEGWAFLSWDCLRGLRQAGRPQTLDEIRDPVEAVNRLGEMHDTVLLAHNLHLFFDIPELLQAIQNGVTRWKSTGCCLVMISPGVQMRPEIEKLFHVLDLPLPGEPDLFAMQEDLANGVSVQDEDGNAVQVATDYSSARAAKGLTEFEAETAFSLSLVRSGRFSPRVISEVKAQMIRKSGLMEFWQPADIADVGGLDNLKAYIRNRARAFEPDNGHLPKPKGIMLAGVPGTGKSLSCKATASLLGWPLIRLDIGALKHAYIGESERRMREATRIIDAFGEAVVWCDEIEKALAGSRSSGETDAGTTASMLGHLLTWMQETKAPVLFMATANDISKLPPEFIRRFDALFFVDLPSAAERSEIIRIMNRKYNAEISEAYAEKLQGYTGAEIEQLAKDSLFDGIDEALNGIVPLAKTMREEISALREWARTRARSGNTPEVQPVELRKIRTG